MSPVPTSVKRKSSASVSLSKSIRSSPRTPNSRHNGTILLESSSEQDVIEPSVVESSCEFDWIRTPRAARLRARETQPTPSDSQPKRSTSLSCAKNSSQPLAAAVAKLKSSGPAPATPKNENYLVGSKLRNVEAWLTATAPRSVATQPAVSSESPFEPKLEKILRSVYGNAWMDQAVEKCKTDVKKSLPKNKRQAATETKLKPATNKVSPKNIIKPVRRKIFDSPKSLTTQEDAETDNGSKSTRKKANKRKFSIVETSSPTTAVPSRMKSPLTIANNEMTPRRTFLSSLAPQTPSAPSHPEAHDFKINFKKKKEELCAKLFKLYNVEIFNGQLPVDMKITWNPRLRGSAGYCYCKRRRDRFGAVTRHARIELSPKVIDRADRLRDTLIHEMCHAAAWIINDVLDNHGSIWLDWTRQARARFPELPTINRCHSYDIASKFVYKCVQCGYQIKRHSKSIDVERKRCGKCYGVLQLFTTKKVPGDKENPKFDITKTLRAPNAFARFVKDNYKLIKEIHPDKKHQEIMKIISERYADFKKSLDT